MKRFFSPLLLLVLSLFTITTTLAQKSDKRLVNVPVAVSDREGHYIANLKKEDFAIFQDGVKQEIVNFETEQEPVSVGILVDTSRSADKILDKIKDAAKNFVKLLNPKDQALIATFDSDVNVLSQFTNDHTALENAIEKVSINDRVGTVMRRAINQIVKNSFANVKGRKALIVLTDGKDFGSYMTKEELIESLQESDVMVYTVYYKTGMDLKKLETMPANPTTEGKKEKKVKKKKGFSLDLPDGDFPTEADVKQRENNDNKEAIDALKKMSDTTAGRFYERDITDLNTTFEQIAGELRQQYRLTFYSTNNSSQSKSLNEILVKVLRPDAVVRTRGGFKLNQ